MRLRLRLSDFNFALDPDNKPDVNAKSPVGSGIALGKPNSHEFCPLAPRNSGEKSQLPVHCSIGSGEVNRRFGCLLVGLRCHSFIRRRNYLDNGLMATERPLQRRRNLNLPAPHSRNIESPIDVYSLVKCDGRKKKNTHRNTEYRALSPTFRRRAGVW